MITRPIRRVPAAGRRRPHRAASPRAVPGVLLLLLLTLSGAAGAVDVQQMRVHAAPDHTRLVLDLSGPVDWSHFELDEPSRLVVDLDRGSLRFDPERLDLAGTPIRRVRTGDRGDGGLRVVLDLARPLEPKPFDLPPVAPYGHRLVIDLYETGSPRREPEPAAGPKRDVVVAIDAGHGGEDPGALGPGGIQEKRVVHSIARRVDALFDAAPGFRGELIRTGDYYVPLRRRTELAREHRADMFVSIHADAFKSPQPRGASVFALSSRGATSETARWLAEKENRSDLIGGVGGVSLADKDPVLAEVLLDLSMSGALAASLDVGERVLGELGRATRLHSRQVHQAGFAVLKSPDIPSILVETGFISNPQEARLLDQAEHQDRLARAIFDGVRAHLAHQPPPGTLLAWRRAEGERRYTIERGDTLSDIAARFGVDTRSLMSSNGLDDHVIRVGQVLVIPPG
jgi:N-acetylmuramoyl-L-alanine amidase